MTEPVHMSKILPDVPADIERRMDAYQKERQARILRATRDYFAGRTRPGYATASPARQTGALFDEQHDYEVTDDVSDEK